MEAKAISNEQRYFDLIVKGETTIEDAAVQIIALQSIECSNRASANNLEAGSAIYFVNMLFDAIKNGEQLKPESEFFQDAESAWSRIKDTIHKINNSGRISTETDRVKKELGL